ncbi:hypothetical protein [Parvibaculum sp.]|uniref:hypothetical protein n=1 Tax=Parvibaculum sp. TaxID=2024848 RepID=UPI0027322B2C|nr:hypothetical protein [Parvibaculum sp.]MDP1625733.1 hypothetical protein [Parvibaculum sp.]MDP2149096.1 hypothetical protein [Parvibaculum sp.]MDP3328365.1 hypothetical protein [Parvibaculum sp.]
MAFFVAATGVALAQPAGPQQGQQPSHGQTQGQQPSHGQQQEQPRGGSQGQQQKPQQGQPHISQQNRSAKAAPPEFRAQDSQAVRTYFRQNMQTPVPLPRGTKLIVGQKRPLRVEYRDVPPPLLKRLPAYDGYSYYLAGNDLILVAIATGVIVDILTSVH